MKKVAGYFVFAVYLSLAGILCLYIGKPAISSGPDILCAGHNQNVNTLPRDGNLKPELIPRQTDAFYKLYHETSDENSSHNPSRIIYC